MEKVFGDSCGTEFIRVVKANFNSVKAYADKTFDQLNEEQLHAGGAGEINSIAILIQHISGNLVSRFTEFFSSDGEKPNRNRDAEFVDQNLTKQELKAKWEAAWNILFSLLEKIKEEELLKTVYIRNEPHTVMEALNRQLWHYAYHTGQIVSMAKQLKGDGWKNLSIPKKNNQ